jgi:hypothetical protein
MTRMANDLGGAESLSAGEQQLIRRCAMISVHCELMEQDAAAGSPFDAAMYGVLTGHLARTLSQLGLKRVPRDMTPTLQSYLEARRQQINIEAEALLEEADKAP